jgi:hypothetical protein
MKAAEPAITALGSVSIAVMAELGGFRFDRRYYFDPAHRWEQDASIARWAEAAFAPYRLYNAEAHLVQLDHQPRPFRQVGGLQPNLILGAALGAELAFYGDKDPDIRGTPLAIERAVEELEAVRWEGREPIATFLAQIDELRAAHGDTVDVFPPFFWDRSGRATVHGPVTTAQKLIGTDVFLMLLEDPGRAAAILRSIAQAYRALIHLFARRAGLPVTGIHVGECSGCMVSPEDWERAILPAVNLMAAACGPVRIHSCGRSDHILEAMTGVNNLAVVNIVSPTSVARARELAGPHVKIDLVPDPRALGRGTPDQLAAWVRRSIEENGGGPLEIQLHLDAGVPIANACAILDELVACGYRPYEESLVERWGL